MSSASSSRRSFYPLPPSAYPLPLIDPDAAFETTYGHHHCSHSIRDENFFRSRTLNPRSATARTMSASGGAGFGSVGGEVPVNSPLATAAQGIYPRHGTGQFVAPYYRRDSKGFRCTFAQPEHVDDAYTGQKDLIAPLVASGLQFAHPSSRPTYGAAKSAVGGGTTFVTSYRNSGLYDSVNAAQTSRVSRQVAEGLQFARSQAVAEHTNRSPVFGQTVPAAQQQFQQTQQPLQPQQFARQTYGQTPKFAFGRQQPQSLQQAQQQQQPAQQQLQNDQSGFGYYTNDVRDAPPAGAELYDGTAPSNLQQQQRAEDQRTQLAGDPLLENPLDNAYRKSRTVYQRSFGRSQ